MFPTPHATRVARLVLPHVDEIDFAPGFRRRAAIAGLPASPVTHDIRSPTYLTDLGVRLSTDPSRFLALNLGLDAPLETRALAERADGDAELERLALAWRADDLSTVDLLGIVNGTALFTGDWDTLGRLAHHVLDTGRPIDDYALAVAAGTLLAKQADARALDALERAADIAAGPYLRFMARLRRAAALTKRFADPRAALSVLDDATKSARESVDNLEMTRSDLGVLESVADNLSCLALLSDGADPGRVMAVLDAAETRMLAVDHEDLVVVDVDAAARYRAQIRVNAAQLRWRAGQRDAAVQRIERHVVVTRDEHPYSLSEALSIAGEFAYLTGKLDDAIGQLRAAEAMLVDEATPVRLAACRKVLVAAYHKHHDEQDRDEVLAALTDDPLGLALLRKNVGSAA